MSPSAIISLVALTITLVFSLCGIVAWFHLYMARFKETIRSEIAEGLAQERKERTAALTSLNGQLQQIGSLTQAVALMGKSIEHLTEKLSGNQEFITEVRNAVSAIDERLHKVALEFAKTSAPSRASRSRKKPPTPSL